MVFNSPTPPKNYIKRKGTSMIKWTKKNAMVFQNHSLVKRLKVIPNIVIFLFILIFMVTYVVVLSTQVQNTNMRSSKLIIKSRTPKKMAKFGFGRKHHDLKHFELDFLFHIS